MSFPYKYFPEDKQVGWLVGFMAYQPLWVI